MNQHWPLEAIWQAVEPQWPGLTVELVPQIDSTNTELMRRARAGQTEPVLLVALHQSAGRGRLGREWHSHENKAGQPDASASLTFSLGLPLAMADWSGLSLVVGLAVVNALHTDLQLKWPNDIWLEGRKLGGILIETASMGQQRYAVIGMGLNIKARHAQGLRTPPAALEELLPQVQAQQALALVVPAVMADIRLFQHQGFAPWQARFLERDALLGQTVVCSNGVQGQGQGVDASGALLLQTAEGSVRIDSAEISVRSAAN